MAGLNLAFVAVSVSFRVYYEEQGDQHFVKQAVEIPPPPLEGAQ